MNKIYIYALAEKLGIEEKSIDDLVIKYNEQVVERYLLNVFNKSAEENITEPLDVLKLILEGHVKDEKIDKTKGKIVPLEKENKTREIVSDRNKNISTKPKINQNITKRKIQPIDKKPESKFFLKIDELEKHELEQFSIVKQDKKLIKKFIDVNTHLEFRVNTLIGKIQNLEDKIKAVDKCEETIKTHTEIQLKDKTSTKYGFYCLLTVLSMSSYIVGVTGYFFFDLTFFPKIYAYLGAIAVPLIAIGLVMGLLARSVIGRIVQWKN
jgi:hypothetical protein